METPLTDPTGTALPIAHGHSGCACHCADEAADPVLDARTIPHAIRHGAIFGALDSLAAGDALVLVAPHEPVPLLARARERYADGIEVEYLETGPDAWRIRLQRV